MNAIDYSSLRDAIKNDSSKIWTFYTASPALFSRIIRLGTRSKVSHVWFLVYFSDRLWTVDMMEGKWCRLLPASNCFKKGSMVWIGSRRTNRDPEDFLSSLLKDVWSIDYDLKWALLSPFFDTRSAQRFCSEWVSEKIPLLFLSLNRWIYPADIMEKCDDIYLLSV